MKGIVFILLILTSTSTYAECWLWSFLGFNCEEKSNGPSTTPQNEQITYSAPTNTTKRNLPHEVQLMQIKQTGDSDKFKLSLSYDSNGEVASIYGDHISKNGEVIPSDRLRMDPNELERGIDLRKERGIPIVSAKFKKNTLTIRTMSSFGFFGPSYREDSLKLVKNPEEGHLLVDPENGKKVTELEFDPHLNKLGFPNNTEVKKIY